MKKTLILYFQPFILPRDLLDEAKDYHLMPERRNSLQTFKTRPRCCTDVVGIIYAVGGLTSSGTGPSVTLTELTSSGMGPSITLTELTSSGMGPSITLTELTSPGMGPSVTLTDRADIVG